MLNITTNRFTFNHYYERAFVRLLITLVKAAVCAPSIGLAGEQRNTPLVPYPLYTQYTALHFFSDFSFCFSV